LAPPAGGHKGRPYETIAQGFSGHNTGWAAVWQESSGGGRRRPLPSKAPACADSFTLSRWRKGEPESAMGGSCEGPPSVPKPSAKAKISFVSGSRYSSGTDWRSVDEMLRESDDFFLERGPVHNTLRALAERLEREGIAYAVLGGMALYLLGFRRLTTDVDVLMTREGLRAFRERLVGRGYAAAFPGANKSFRDAETKVKVEVITSGEFPGDGKPKPVSFPDPAVAAEDRGGIRVIGLEKLIELKIASGLSAEYRTLVDLGDVQRLIEELQLPADLAEALDPSVQGEYRRLWELAQRRKEGPHERE